MKNPYQLNKIPAIVIVRKNNINPVMERLGQIFESVHAVVAQNDFPSGSTQFQLDLNINHQRAMQYGLATGRPFLVLEEDAHPTKWFREQVPSQWKGILKMDYNILKPKNCPPVWAEEQWPGLFRCYCQWSCGSYLINDLSQGRELLQAFRDRPDSAADWVFIKMMRKLKFYVIEEPYFYHGPASNPKAKRTNVCMVDVERKWGGVVRLQYDPVGEDLDKELENWRNPILQPEKSDENIS